VQSRSQPVLPDSKAPIFESAEQHALEQPIDAAPASASYSYRRCVATVMGAMTNFMMIHGAHEMAQPMRQSQAPVNAGPRAEAP
jgi:hypothetical protein